MTPQPGLVRKIVYLVAILVLLLPLFWLSQPSAPGVQGGAGSVGGKLAQLREDPKYGLSQANLGQLDPASETIKLATLGMRGVAATFLWEKSNHYKMKKDWANFGATLEQIIKVQPNFVSVWVYQGHNLSYNVSVEFDDYRERYRWVIKGIDFLKEGTEYNRREPILQWHIGWFISQKIGRADEWRQFRRLFQQDDDFHGSRALAQRDNWLVGREWFQRVEELVDRGAKIKSNPLIYRSHAPMCLMSYAEALEKDGTFGEVAKREWKKAADEWQRYGSIDIPTTDEAVPIIHLNDQERREEAAADLARQLDALQPGLREKIAQQKRAALKSEQREALDTPPERRTDKQVDLAIAAEQELQVSHDEVARQIQGPNRRKAINLAKQALENQQVARMIKQYRDIINFNYWRLHAQVEQTDEAVAAHEWIYKGDTDLADLEQARAAYDKGFAAWRKVLDNFPALVRDDTTVSDLMDIINRYKRILGQRDENEPLPKDFILQDIVTLHDKKQQ
jgi:hypothetical protein